MAVPQLDFRFVVELIDPESRNLLGRTGVVTPDLEPAMQCARFEVWRRELPFGRAFEFAPVWKADPGPPYVEGISVALDGAVLATAPFTIFQSAASRHASLLIERGRIEENAPYLYRVAAYAGGPAAAPGRPRLEIEEVEEDFPPIQPGLLTGDALTRAEHRDSAYAEEDDFEIFVPESVLDQAAALAGQAEGKEIGGFLIGHLTRDAAGDVALMVTGQISARHTDRAVMSLTFTPKTWSALEAAIDLRRRGEQVVGFHHLHPASGWCRKCTEQCSTEKELHERLTGCPYQAPFFSADDCHVMRTAFPYAYQVGLLVVDTTLSGLVFAMFGWRNGQVARRGFHVFSDRKALAGPVPVAGAA